MKFQELGFNSKEEYFKEFFSTLLETNRTAQFFVDWKKVHAHIKVHLDEISLLNGLVNIPDSKERRKHLKEILEKYPKTRLVLPLIIAIRDEKIDVLKIGDNGSVSYMDVDFKNSTLERILDFCDQSEIIELLGKVKDLHSYLTGVEVGMDTNARKNRSGIIFERLIIDALKRKGVDAREAKGRIDIGRKKKPDIVIYKDGQVFAIAEVNFFFGLGSKPLETVQSYINLQREANARKIRFLFITDGPAWRTGKAEREKAFDQIDYPMNFALATKLIPKMVEKG